MSSVAMEVERTEGNKAAQDHHSLHPCKPPRNGRVAFVTQQCQVNRAVTCNFQTLSLNKQSLSLSGWGQEWHRPIFSPTADVTNETKMCLKLKQPLIFFHIGRTKITMVTLFLLRITDLHSNELHKGGREYLLLQYLVQTKRSTGVRM